MKNIEWLDRLRWDSPKYTSLYALCFAILLGGIFYRVSLAPLLNDIDRLSHQKSTVVKHEVPRVIQAEIKMCDWKKTLNTWQLIGSFAYVQDCVLHGVPHDLSVQAIQLKQHVMGVSATMILRGEHAS